MLSVPVKAAAVERPELVFGLIGPLGVPMKGLHGVLRQALLEVSCESDEIRLIKLASELPDAPSVPVADYPSVARAKMDLGSWVRKQWGSGDALARLAVLGVRNARKAVTLDLTKPASQRAYVLHQLKHPDEVRLLRDVYGGRFILVGGYAPRSWRITYVAGEIARNRTTYRERRRILSSLVGATPSRQAPALEGAADYCSTAHP
jgi:hypothetical protein